jgi:hypothetical protein
VPAASEDCLYLNVYAPVKSLPTHRQATKAAPAAALPVMIYFPAGQFMWGSGNDAENFNAPQTVSTPPLHNDYAAVLVLVRKSVNFCEIVPHVAKLASLLSILNSHYRY